MKHRDEPFAVQVGGRVRRLREAAGMSQATLAVRASLHPATISKIELGRSEMQSTTAVRISAALELPPSGLFAGVRWVPNYDSPGDGVWRIAPEVDPADGADGNHSSVTTRTGDDDPRRREAPGRCSDKRSRPR